MKTETWRDPPGQALGSATPEPASGLGPSGNDPSRGWKGAFEHLSHAINRAERNWTRIAEAGGCMVAGVLLSADEAYVAAGACESLAGLATKLAQGMSAGTAETAQQAQGEARQPGPQDAPNAQ